MVFVTSNNFLLYNQYPKIRLRKFFILTACSYIFIHLFLYDQQQNIIKRVNLSKKKISKIDMVPLLLGFSIFSFKRQMLLELNEDFPIILVYL